MIVKLNKKRILKSVAYFYQVKLVLRKDLPDHAYVDLINDIIYIQYNDQVPLSFLLSSFFHEYAHLICKHKNIYPLYHSDTLKLNKKQQTSFLKTIWRAESFVDKLGMALMKTHFNGYFKYHKGYTKDIKPAIFPAMTEMYKNHFKDVNYVRKNSLQLPKKGL